MKTIDWSLPIQKLVDGAYIVHLDDGREYCINDTEEFTVEYADCKKFELDRPEAVQLEPLPLPPSDEQLEAVAESQRQALFREYDTAIMRLKRAERLGDLTATASIAQWDAYAVALQALNDTEGWFRDTVWPTRPEV